MKQDWVRLIIKIEKSMLILTHCIQKCVNLRFYDAYGLRKYLKNNISLYCRSYVQEPTYTLLYVSISADFTMTLPYLLRSTTKCRVNLNYTTILNQTDSD